MVLHTVAIALVQDGESAFTASDAHDLVRWDGWGWACEQNKPDGVRDGVDCCAHDLIMVHSYKAESYDSIIRWLEYEHFERAHQAVYKDLIRTAQQLQLALAATG
jgi:hypothetical protein